MLSTSTDDRRLLITHGGPLCVHRDGRFSVYKAAACGPSVSADIVLVVCVCVMTLARPTLQFKVIGQGKRLGLGCNNTLSSSSSICALARRGVRRSACGRGNVVTRSV